MLLSDRSTSQKRYVASLNGLKEVVKPTSVLPSEKKKKKTIINFETDDAHATE